MECEIGRCKSKQSYLINISDLDGETCLERSLEMILEYMDVQSLLASLRSPHDNLVQVDLSIIKNK